MNIEKLKQFVQLANELEEVGVMGFHFHNKEIHVNQDVIKGFDNLQIETRGGSKFPYEISVDFDGFTIFCIAEEEDLKEFPQFKEFRRAELLKKLAELEKEEELA